MEENEYRDSSGKYRLNLSLWLDDYDDVYSDFDSRNYLKRRVSADFISELRTSLKNKTEEITDLVLVLPKDKRVAGSEQVIIENLKNYFNHQFNFYHRRYKKDFKKGIILLFAGLLLMVANSYISFHFHNNLMSAIIRIVLEPFGWFLAWISFDILYYELRELRKEKYFFYELSKINICFQSSDSYAVSE